MTALRLKFSLTGLLHLIFILQVESSIFVTDLKMNKMIELNARKPHCRLHTDRGNIQSTVLNTDPLKIRQVPEETIATLENVCFEGNQLTGEIQGGLSFIYPGTLWCGPGDLAKNSSDLGRYTEEDRCCRAHDMCMPQIAPGECLKSICNRGSFTRLHCDCDEKFRKCLSALNTETANTLGAAFFNAIQVTCFDYRRPCSSLQRDDCRLTFFTSKRYKIPERVIPYQSQKIVAEARTSDNADEFSVQEESGGPVDPYSINLILNGLLENFVFRPLKTFGNFIIVTKSIYYDPSTPLDPKYLIN